MHLITAEVWSRDGQLPQCKLRKMRDVLESRPSLNYVLSWRINCRHCFYLFQYGFSFRIVFLLILLRTSFAGVSWIETKMIGLFRLSFSYRSLHRLNLYSSITRKGFSTAPEYKPIHKVLVANRGLHYKFFFFLDRLIQKLSSVIEVARLHFLPLNTLTSRTWCVPIPPCEITQHVLFDIKS